jgi:hypothetical protein
MVILLCAFVTGQAARLQLLRVTKPTDVARLGRSWLPRAAQLRARLRSTINAHLFSDGVGVVGLGCHAAHRCELWAMVSEFGSGERPTVRLRSHPSFAACRASEEYHAYGQLNPSYMIVGRGK